MFLFLLYDILLCGIARFSRGNKKELRTFQPQKSKKKKIRTASLKQSLLVLLKKSVIQKEICLAARNGQAN